MRTLDQVSVGDDRASPSPRAAWHRASSRSIPADDSSREIADLLTVFDDVYRFGERQGRSTHLAAGRCIRAFDCSVPAWPLMPTGRRTLTMPTVAPGLDDLLNAGQPAIVGMESFKTKMEVLICVQGPDESVIPACLAFPALLCLIDPNIVGILRGSWTATKISTWHCRTISAEADRAAIGRYRPILVSSRRTGIRALRDLADTRSGFSAKVRRLLAENLESSSDAPAGREDRAGISYFVFSGSGDGQPRSVDEINQRGASLVQRWAGPKRSGVRRLGPIDRSARREHPRQGASRRSDPNRGPRRPTARCHRH